MIHKELERAFIWRAETMGTELSAPENRARPLVLAGIALTVVAGCAFLGASTNAINGLVSPTYFVNILRWHHVENVWRASIAQGILEGLLFGIVLALLFTAVTGIITKATCTYRFAVRHLLWILVGAFGCWVLGGLLAMGLAFLSPEFYRQAFLGVPDEPGPMFRYAWVGGSIMGVQLGGLVCVGLGLIWLRASWQRQATNTTGTVATAIIRPRDKFGR